MNWNDLLLEWERESRHILSLVPPDSTQNPSVIEDRESKHFFPSAQKDVVEEVESTLEVRFPEELKSFYQASNGWKLVGMGDMCLMSVEGVGKVEDGPPNVRWEVAEYLFKDGCSFVSQGTRDRLLLLSGPSRTGFIVANPRVDGDWGFGIAEFGAPFNEFDDFASCMKELRWLCHHYLRAYFDYL